MQFTEVFIIKCLSGLAQAISSYLLMPVLLLPLLYECSVTTVGLLLSGANERRHYQRIGPSLTPLPENNRWTKSLT